MDAGWVIAALRELDRRTGGPGGARRVAWSEPWQAARTYLAELLGELGLELERDEAGNLWAWLEGEREPGLVLGSHLDSVPAGGWLDGALGVFSALGVIRAWATSGLRPPRSLGLVDWADEEGARFGRSLFGSSAFAGTLDRDAARAALDQQGTRLEAVMAAEGLDLDRALDSGSRRARVAAYLELHIEQGPVLEHERLPVAAVGGCVGVERVRCRFGGEAAHAGSTPMALRHDAGLAAAAAGLAFEAIALRHEGVATTGQLDLRPGVATVVPGAAELVVDLRHAEPEQLAKMLEDVLEAARSAAEARGCGLEIEQVWRVDPTAFDERLVQQARAASAEVARAGRVLISGALHDAAEVARVAPAAMIFAASSGGISHSPAEDTAEQDLIAAITAFGLLTERVLRDASRSG